MKYHPDITGEDSAKFLEIKEAYDFLMEHHKAPVEKSFDRMFADMFKTMNKGRGPVQVVITRCTVDEAVTGFQKEINFIIEVPCSVCNAFTRNICKNCKGLGFKKEALKDTFEFKDINEQDQNFWHRDYYKGVDLCIKVKIVPPGDFKIKDNHTESVENINIFHAILGGKFKVKTLEGEEEIDLPPGNISEFSFILKGKGFQGQNHVIKLKPFLAKNLTDDQKRLLNNILHGENNENKI